MKEILRETTRFQSLKQLQVKWIQKKITRTKTKVTT